MERYKFADLLGAAETLHEHTTGSSDALHPTQEAEVYEFLRMRMRDWQPTNLNAPVASREYDLAVWRLVQAALAEYEASHWVRGRSGLAHPRFVCGCGHNQFYVYSDPNGTHYHCTHCGLDHSSTSATGTPP